MAGELQDVIDAIVLVQQAVAAPSGEPALKKAWDEVPADPGGAFPCFVNVERDIDPILRSAGLRQYTSLIDMHLLFSTLSTRYSMARRRKWIKPVLDAFDIAVTLHNAQRPVQFGFIESVSFEPYQQNESGYVTATFTLRLQYAEAFDFVA